MQLIGSFIFTLYFLVSILAWSVVVALMIFASHATRFRAVQMWSRSIMTMLRVCCGLTYRVEGADNFPDDAVVILQKHSSTWETIAGMLYCPPHTWVLKRELMWIPLLGIALRSVRVIPINRKGRRDAINQVIEHGTDRLSAGINVMIYPEGTRVQGARNGRFGRSGSLLAASSGASVVPVAHNAGEFWGRHSLRKRAGCVQVVIGKPIPTQGRSAEQINTEAARWMDETMARISHVGHPPSSTAEPSS
ncbi:MAG: lysophospholipid acyltransferase family protein [Gammaproteobacteria bacterium]